MARVPLSTLRDHRADVAAAVLVLLVASALRLAFLFRAPPFFVGGDSETYLQPAMELLWGQGFELIAKRPPGYPLFVAATLASLGQDLQTLSLVQSALGVLTSVAAWAIGRLTFGRLAGLVAGLLVATNGTLIIFEHYVMAETVFTFFVTTALLLLLLAAREPRRRWLIGAGLALGLATTTRQTAQLLVPLGPIALWLAGQSPRSVLRGSGWYLAGFLILVGPWMLADYLPDRSLAAGTLGETLVWRLTRSDSEFFKGRQVSAGDAASTAARRFAWDQASGKELPSDTAVRLQQRFGLSEAEADRVLRDAAFDAIGQQPARYVASSAQIFLTHLLGQEQYLGGQGKEGGRTRFANVETRYAFWDERAKFLLNDPTAAQQNEFRRAQAIATWFQPYRFGLPLLILALAGLSYGALRRDSRPVVVLALGVVGLIGSAALLAGDLPRYRYPADPLLAVLEAGGVVGIVQACLWLARRARLRPTTARTLPGPASNT